MSVSDIIMYIVLMLMIVLTAFNLYAMITSGRRKKAAEASYSQEIGIIEKKLISLQNSRGLEFTEIRRFMNDKGEGIILVRDRKRGMSAIAMRESISLFRDDELKSAGKEYRMAEGRKGRVLSSSVHCIIGDTRYEYVTGASPYNPKGFLGKVIVDTTEEFCTALQEIIDSR